MKRLPTSIALAAATMLFVAAGAGAQQADTVTMDFELGGGNGACGRFEPTAGVRYDRDSATVPARFALSAGPNGGCSGQAVSVDAAVSRHVEIGAEGGVFVDLTAAYQRQTVPTEYLRNVAGDPFKHFAGTDIQTAQAAAGVGLRFGDAWTASVGYSAIEQLDEHGDDIAPWRVSLSGEVLGVEVDVAAIEHVTWVSLNYEATDRIVFGANAVRGMSRLQNDAPATIGDYLRAGGPETVYRLYVGWRL